MNIYVGNLSYKMNDNDLEAVFAKFGAVKSAKIIMDKETGRSKGFAFVEMEEASAGNASIGVGLVVMCLFWMSFVLSFVRLYSVTQCR